MIEIAELCVVRLALLAELEQPALEALVVEAGVGIGVQIEGDPHAGRSGAVFVLSLADGRGTWVLVRSGEVVPSGSTLAVGDRVLQVSALAPWCSFGDSAVTMPELEERTRVFAAA